MSNRPLEGRRVEYSSEDSLPSYYGVVVDAQDVYNIIVQDESGFLLAHHHKDLRVLTPIEDWKK